MRLVILIQDCAELRRVKPDPREIGKKIILSFSFTCSPKWREICRNQPVINKIIDMGKVSIFLIEGNYNLMARYTCT